jgi:ferritin-like metal-binding protein YciE
MPQQKSPYDMFIEEIREPMTLEKQLIKALPKLAGATVSDDLTRSIRVPSGGY